VFALTMTVGIAVSVLLLELTGLIAGGIIVPAYVSLILASPASMAALLGMALAVLVSLRILGHWLLLYGARRYGVSVLLGALLNAGAQHWLQPTALPIEWSAFGYLVPGLMAYHCDRQGILKTVLMIAIAAPLVRAIVLLVAW